MSTSEARPSVAAAELAPEPAVSSLPLETPVHASGPSPDWLDPSVLTRMANEFFTALPALDVLPGRAGSVDAAQRATPFDSAPATFPAAPPEISLPSNPHFPSVPASAGPAVVAPVTAPVQATAPPLSGVADEAASAAPPFAFLQDARPIFSDKSSAPQTPYPAAKPMSELVADGAPPGVTQNDESLPTRLAEVTQPPSPALPAAAAPVDSSALPAFSFLEDARPLFSYPPRRRTRFVGPRRRTMGLRRLRTFATTRADRLALVRLSSGCASSLTGKCGRHNQSTRCRVRP